MTKKEAFKQAIWESNMCRMRDEWQINTYDTVAHVWRSSNQDNYRKAREYLTIWRTARVLELLDIFEGRFAADDRWLVAESEKGRMESRVWMVLSRIRKNQGIVKSQPIASDCLIGKVKM